MFYDKFKFFINDTALSSLDPIEHENFYRIAECSNQCFSEWFGTPSDSRWTFSIKKGCFTGLLRERLIRHYTIVIHRDYKYTEQHHAAIGHEMYHRVTYMCEGLRQFVWVDEMMAFLTTQRFLKDQGFAQYGEYIFNTYDRMNGLMSVKDLEHVRSKRVLLGIRGLTYPPNFAVSVGVLGKNIESIVGWDYLPSILKSRDWDDWIGGLPLALRSRVRQLLKS